MIEVFKTNVHDATLAHAIVQGIEDNFPEYTANFDLEDCDKILRIKSVTTIQPFALIIFLKAYYCKAEILQEKVFPLSEELQLPYLFNNN